MILWVDASPLEGTYAPRCVAKDAFAVVFRQQLGWNWNIQMVFLHL